ncbi:hypothetical protein CR162_21270 [Pseudoroseomonas rhizosphaerae]|uniref:Uncharacterized protein n=1 Tax=Teichococcus rhizosphaerae TaxID=1335062 RepID=A0A2C6Z332_9PROT|nr:hypothetical protein CR162_21270 [Pseudoroseomonas rhizosphaerae]
MAAGIGMADGLQVSLHGGSVSPLSLEDFIGLGGSRFHLGDNTLVCFDGGFGGLDGLVAGGLQGGHLLVEVSVLGPGGRVGPDRQAEAAGQDEAGKAGQDGLQGET